MPVNNVYDLLLVLTNFNDEFTFKQWLKDTCQMRRDCLENCYQDLQSRLQDPTVLKELNSRRKHSPNTTRDHANFNSTKTTTLLEFPENNRDDHLLDILDVPGIGKKTAFRLQENAVCNIFQFYKFT